MEKGNYYSYNVVPVVLIKKKKERRMIDLSAGIVIFIIRESRLIRGRILSILIDSLKRYFRRLVGGKMEWKVGIVDYNLFI